MQSADCFTLYLDFLFYEKTKDWQNFAKISTIFAKRYQYNNHQNLNRIAYKFFEYIDDKECLDEAIVWSKRSLELYYDSDYVITYASLLYKRGRKAEAKVVIKKAIESARKKGGDSSSFKELLSKITKQ